MKKWMVFAVVAVFGLLQLTMLDYFKIFNIKPDLLLICIIFFSLALEPKYALALSVFAGILKDISGSGQYGLNTLMFALWSFSVMRLAREITIDYDLIRMLVVFAVALLHNIVSGLVLVSSGASVPFGIFFRIVIVGSMYTALVSLLVFKVITHIFFISRLRVKNGPDKSY